MNFCRVLLHSLPGTTHSIPIQTPAPIPVSAGTAGWIKGSEPHLFQCQEVCEPEHQPWITIGVEIEIGIDHGNLVPTQTRERSNA